MNEVTLSDFVTNDVKLADIFAESKTLIQAAKSSKKTIATAESCTGGLIGAAITSMTGSSACFKGGIIAYDNSVKTKQLNIPVGMIHKYGAVSREVARAMAANTIDILNVDLAVSVTGVAGPGGGSAAKPVGTVWMGLSQRRADGIETRTKCFNFGDIGRNKVRDATCYEALKALNAALGA
ncbi:MAG: CinA family protein [Maricaulaceae bacterium]